MAITNEPKYACEWKNLYNKANSLRKQADRITKFLQLLDENAEWMNIQDLDFALSWFNHTDLTPERVIEKAFERD